MTETLNNLQPYTGTLTLTGVEDLLKQLTSGSIPNVPSNVSCTDCSKESFNIAKQSLGGLIVNSNTQNAIQSQCGASFVGELHTLLHILLSGLLLAFLVCISTLV